MRNRLLAVPVLFAAAALAACSSSSSGSPTSAAAPPSSDSSTSAPDTTSAPPSSTPMTSSSSTSTGSGLTAAQAKAALLTAGQIGASFAATGSSSADTPLPCTPNDPPLDKQFPPLAKAETEFQGLKGAAYFSEEIETYSSAADVAKTFAAGEKGLGCGTTKVSGVTASISKPQDITTLVSTKIDKGEGWDIVTSQLKASLVVCQLGQHIVVFSFGALPTVKSNQLPDGQKVIYAALAKVAAALK